MKPLSAKARRLFELSRDEPGPDAVVRARIADALAARIASEAGTASAVATGAAPATGKAVLLKAVGQCGLVACVGAVATVAWLTLSPPRQPATRGSDRSQARALANAPAAEELLPPAEAPAAPPAKASRPPSPRRAVESSPPRQEHTVSSARVLAEAKETAAPGLADSPPPVQPVGDLPPVRALVARPSTAISVQPQVDDPLRAETDALRTAQQALRTGQPRLALDLLAAQDRRFADGALEQERLAARVLALCQAGLVAEARTQAARFEERWPRSPLKSRVRSACWGR